MPLKAKSKNTIKEHGEICFSHKEAFEKIFLRNEYVTVTNQDRKKYIRLVFSKKILMESQIFPRFTFKTCRRMLIDDFLYGLKLVNDIVEHRKKEKEMIDWKR